jgi:hypothetical protein
MFKIKARFVKNGLFYFLNNKIINLRKWCMFSVILINEVKEDIVTILGYFHYHNQ